MIRIARLSTLAVLLSAVAFATAHARAPERAPIPLRSAVAPRAAESRDAALTAPDGAGGLYIAWSDRRDGHDDIYVLRVTAAGQPAAGWPATGVLACGASGHQRLNSLVPDGANGVVAVWEDERTSRDSNDLWAQRVNPAGLTMWSADGVLLAREAARTSTPMTTGDGTGGVIAIWRFDGTDTDVMAARLDGAGATPAGWSSDGIPVCAVAQNQEPGGVVGDGAGGAYVVWADQRAGAEGVYAQHLSASGAKQWSSDGQRVDVGEGSGYPLACADGAGGVITAWTQFDLLRAQRLNAAGAPQWESGGVRVCDTAGPTAFSLDPAPGSGAFVAWTRNPGGEYELRAQSLSGAGARAWDTTGVVVAHTGPRYTWGMRTIADGAGGAVISWMDGRNGAAGEFALWSQRLGATGAAQWSADGVLVAGAPTLPSAPEMVGTGAGGALMAWYDFATRGDVIRVQQMDGAGVPQFTANGRLLVSDEGAQYGESSVPDGAGGVWTVWTQTSNGQPDLWARRLGSNGQPAGPKVLVCGAPGRQFLASVVADGAGGVLVAWTDERPSGSGSDLYAQRIGAASSALWAADGVKVSATGVGVQTGGIAADGAGGAYLFWTNYGGDVRAQHLGAAGVATWAAGGVGVCADPGYEYSRALVGDASGVIVVWSDDRVSHDAGVYAQRLDGTGAAQWTTDGVRIGSFGDVAAYPLDAVSDGASGAIALLLSSAYDAGTNNFRDTLRVQRVTAAGAAAWGTRGVEVRGATGELEGFRLAADGLGGAIVAWSEERSAPANVYAQRVNASGTAQWTAGGLTVCDAGGSQEIAGLAGDGAGGAFVSWTDERATPADLYAQKLAASGAAQWGANGTAVAAGPRGQYAGGIAADGAGGAFVTWVDHVSGTLTQMTAQRLASNGSPQWGPGGVTSVLATLVAATLDGEGAHVEWQLAEAGVVTIERAREGGAWESLAERASDGERRVRFDDASLDAGERRGYRLRRRGAGGDVVAGEVWLEPAASGALALSAPAPNPARGAFTLAFTLPLSGPATVELYDVGGRLVERHAIGAAAAGRHVLRVGERVDHAGVYFARLTQGGRESRVRVVVAR